MKYSEMSKEQLQNEYTKVRAEYDSWCQQNLSLDMARGKPGPDQMDLSLELFDLVNTKTGFKNFTGIDCRNYGGLDGLIELKNLFSEIMGVAPDQVIVGGNSSLNMMYDTISQAMVSGFSGEKPWLLQDEPKFICPAPGYDRHFAICEHFGIKMITVPLNEDGPDMDTVEELVKDESVKGMWCVPKYSNPDGITYSDETVRRIAKLEPAAKDFRIFWDNAYAIHNFRDDDVELLNIYEECKKHGHENNVLMFVSTSKITFPGAGVAAEAASPQNVAELKARMKYQTIGPDKLNQLRHARMFPDIESLLKHMKRHSDIIRPKFDAVLSEFDKHLLKYDIAHWAHPTGGYFISLFVNNGCAQRTVELCKKAGLILTPAGATYPYGVDPNDSNIRIAPSYPLVSDLVIATDLLCTAIKLSTLEKMLGAAE